MVNNLSATERRHREIKNDIKIIKKFLERKEVENNKEYEILRNYEDVGIVHLSFSFKKRKTYAILTEKAKGLLSIG